MKLFATQAEAARLLGLSRSRIGQLIEAKQLPVAARTVDGHPLLSVEAVKTYGRRVSK